VPSDAPLDRDATPNSYVQRAELLADLGRYDEAAGELDEALALDPGNPAAHAMLASVYLAAERPADALTAADAAIAAAPGSVPALVARAMALGDLRRFPEAARVADEILRLAPDDPYALWSAAAIYAESRNGQPALDIAWRAAQLAPEEPRAHLVLAVVAAGLKLFDLAERAYREALRRKPDLAEARDEPGVVRLAERRYSRALERLSEGAEAFQPAAERQVRRADEGLRRLVLFGAGYGLVAAVLVAFVAAAGGVGSRLLAGVLAMAGLGGLAAFGARLRVLPALREASGMLATGGYATVAALVLILLYAFVGSPWPLVFAIVATMAAELALFMTPDP
jgi:tetratricopeptide (TPR) repeat protein